MSAFAGDHDEGALIYMITVSEIGTPLFDCILSEVALGGKSTVLF